MLDIWDEVGRVVRVALIAGMCWVSTAGGRQFASAQEGPSQQTLTVDEIRGKLEGLRAQSGRLTLDGFFAIVRQNGPGTVAIKDAPAAWKLFSDMLRPPIQKEDLEALHLATRESIRDVRVVYEVIGEGIPIDNQKVRVNEKQEFATSAGRYLFRRQAGDASKGRERTHVWAYDGKVVRSYTNDSGTATGTVDQFQREREVTNCIGTSSRIR